MTALRTWRNGCMAPLIPNFGFTWRGQLHDPVALTLEKTPSYRLNKRLLYNAAYNCYQLQ
jgi:hypothetical protein